jgi:hypothetical protein
VRFTFSVFELGFLQGREQKEDLEKDTRVELPAWLAHDLTQRGFVYALAPKCMLRDRLAELLASAAALTP